MRRTRVRHLGNTANNAYYNARLLAEYEGIESDLPIRMFGLDHAISAPAWEAVDFQVPSVGWVAHPDWDEIPGAPAVQAEYSDLPPVARPESTTPARQSPKARAMSIARSTIEPLYGRRWAQPIFDVSYTVVLARRPVLPSLADTVDVLYGGDSLIRVKMPTPSARYVCLEHGTVRWIADGGREQAVFRRAYRQQIQRAHHLWITNLDPRTLEIAEDIAPGRWSVLPHPYVPDPHAPFAESGTQRADLLRRTHSESVVLLPSSQNWAKNHDKGSMKALSAFVELRRAGRDVGLVAIEWGLQLAESKAFLEAAGVGANVAWVAPMARVSLQRMMANVDVVWDQFGLEAFGGVAMRTVEQGVPLISRGLSAVGEQLIGGPVPWRNAATTDDVVRETGEVLDEIATIGRANVTLEYRARYRNWLLERHSAKITAQLQREVYDEMMDGAPRARDMAPGRWGQLLNQTDTLKGSD